jgi:hypothetical protein
MAHWEKRLAIANPLRRRPESLVAPVESTARSGTSSRPPLECGFRVPTRTVGQFQFRSTSCRPSVRSLVPSLGRRIVDPQTWLGQMFFDGPI